MRTKDKELWGVTYSRTSSSSRPRGTRLTASTLGTFAASSSLGTRLTLGEKKEGSVGLVQFWGHFWRCHRPGHS